MAEKRTRQLVAEQAIIHAELPVAAHPRHQVDVDRGFEVPTAIYAAMAALFFGFVAVMAIGLATRNLIVPIGIIVVFITMFFAVPAQWVRMGPAHRPGARTLSRFASEGIQTYTGVCTARDAAVQMLIMPALVLCWGMAVMTIVAFAR
ncbi:MAG TPA: hypothetical protein VL100_00855 [Croceibacterium sp.]|nr:hypothetical protein [Croceibacterium sp.]